GRHAIRDLSSQFSTMPLYDTTATKRALISSLKTTRLAHIQTHCDWDSTIPLEHCIEFPKPPTPPIMSSELASEDVTPKSETHKLTAREIFSLHDDLQPGAHLNLLVCGGALTYVDRGDEVLGLIPALLYSGAASVVSTLWRTLDRYAATFGRAFFTE